MIFIEFLGADDVGDAAWWEFLKKAPPRGRVLPRAAAAGCKAMIRAWFVCAGLLLAVATQCRAGSCCRRRPRRPPRRPAAPRAWSSMSPQQQQLLHSYQGKWDSLPPERQQALARGSQRWLSMTPAATLERPATLHAMARHASGAAPAILRQRWQQFKAMPPEQQQRGPRILQPVPANAAGKAHGTAPAMASNDSGAAPHEVMPAGARRRGAVLR